MCQGVPAGATGDIDRPDAVLPGVSIYSRIGDGADSSQAPRMRRLGTGCVRRALMTTTGQSDDERADGGPSRLPGHDRSPPPNPLPQIVTHNEAAALLRCPV